jgi:pimeloyl-ACP methyl ester carboxylesterase
MAGMGEDNVVEFSAALEGESSLRLVLEAQQDTLRTVQPPDLADSLENLLPAVDQAVLTHTFAEDMAESFHEALRISVDGWLDDDLAFAKPWGFHLAEISAPAMLWQGTLDLMVPVAHGEWLADRVPHVSAHIVADEGHLSVALGAIDQMLDELCKAGDA